MQVVLYFIIGAVFGSFLSALTYRMQRGINFIWKRSKSDCCGKDLSVVELIPILSFLITKGKCRKCGQKISIRYPIIELIQGALFTLCYPSIILCIFSVILLAICIIDIESMIVPDTFVLLLIVLRMFFKEFSYEPFLATVIILSIVYIYQALRRIYMLGLGDAKLFLAISIYFASITESAIFFIASGLIGIIYALFMKVGVDKRFPFAPAICIAGFVLIFLRVKCLILL